MFLYDFCILRNRIYLAPEQNENDERNPMDTEGSSPVKASIRCAEKTALISPPISGGRGSRVVNLN
jgi:hypothetical protein